MPPDQKSIPKQYWLSNYSPPLPSFFFLISLSSTNPSFIFEDSDKCLKSNLSFTTLIKFLSFSPTHWVFSLPSSTGKPNVSRLKLLLGQNFPFPVDTCPWSASGCAYLHLCPRKPWKTWLNLSQWGLLKMHGIWINMQRMEGWQRRICFDSLLKAPCLCNTCTHPTTNNALVGVWHPSPEACLSPVPQLFTPQCRDRFPCKQSAPRKGWGSLTSCLH